MQAWGNPRTMRFWGIIGLIVYIAAGLLPSMLSPEAQEAGEQAAISKKLAADKARQFVQEHYGRNTAQWETAVSYRAQVDMIGYVQKLKVTSEYIKQLEPRYPLDTWFVEVREPASERVYYVDIDLRTGNPVGWTVKPAVEQHGREGRSAGRLVAEHLAARGIPASELRQVDAANGRIEYESAAPLIGDAKARFSAVVSDGRIVELTSGFSVPEVFLAEKNKHDQLGAKLSMYHLFATGALSLLALIWLFIRRRDNDWKRGSVLTLVFLAIYWTMNANMLPAFRLSAFEYGQTEGSAAAVYAVFMSVIAGVLGLGLYFSCVSGEKMWREQALWPSSRDAGFGERIADAMKKGYWICFMLLGVQALLFLAAERGFAFWTTVDPMNSPYNMAIPALFPLMAWVAAIEEEAVYRLFAIAALTKLLRFRPLAVLLSSVIWALGHVQYPIYPVYTRLIEVTVLGILFAVLFLRYGFLVVVFAHAAMDSILMGLSVLTIEGAGNIAAGLLYVVFPALVGLALSAYYRRRNAPPVPG